jgi:hypothetical protein
MIRLLIALLAACVLIGCRTPPRNAALQPQTLASDVPAGYGVPPLWGAGEKRPDAAAPAWVVARAVAHHQANYYAKRFRHFEFCQRRLEGPGYEAKFTKSAGGRLNITYYFDEQGRHITSSSLICIY